MNTPDAFFLFVVLVPWATQGQCAKKKPSLHPSTSIPQPPRNYGKFRASGRGIGPKKPDKMRKYLTVEPLPPNKTQSTHAAAPVKPASAKSGAAQATSPTPKTPPPMASNDEEP